MSAYYIYVSESKLQMLASQEISNSKIKIKGEANFKIPLISELKIAFERENDNRDANIRKVIGAIEDTKGFNDLSKDTKWIKDVLLVKSIAIEGCENLFLLIGKNNQGYHMLGGSAHHVIGQAASERVKNSLSYFPYLASQLERVFDDERFRSTFEKQLFERGADNLILRPHEWAEAVKWLYDDCKSEPFQIEFLARNLAISKCLSGEAATASSPLYVAQL